MLFNTFAVGIAALLTTGSPGDSIKKMHIESIEISSTQFLSDFIQMDFAQMRALALENDFANLNLQDYSMTSSCCVARQDLINFHVNSALPGRNGKAPKGSPMLRLGLSHSNSFYHSLTFFNSNQFTVDSISIIYQGNATTYPIDSIVRETHSFAASSKRLRANAGMLWRSNPKKRWIGYTGFALGFGLAIVSQVEEYYSKWSEITNPIYAVYGNTPIIQSSWQFEGSSRNFYKTPLLWDMSFSLPIGVDFRIGKKENLWYRVHLFSELNPTLWVSSYSKTWAYVNPGVSAVFGIRVNIE